MMKLTIIIFFLSVATSLALPANLSLDGGWKVVGGDTASPGQFPFIISLRIGDSHTCGGSLLTKDWVVTAAHCVSGRSPEYYTVVAGTNKLNTGGVRIKVTEIIVNKDWNSALIINDVALLRLATPIDETDLIKYISLGCDDINDIENCTLIGWGRTSYPGTIPNDLQFLDLLTFPYNDCKSKWNSMQSVVPTEICTLTKSGEGACHGDSGGPLIRTKDGKSSLIGLVSWGSPCARGMPDVYTRVSSFCAWIKDNMKN